MPSKSMTTAPVAVSGGGSPHFANEIDTRGRAAGRMLPKRARLQKMKKTVKKKD